MPLSILLRRSFRPAAVVNLDPANDRVPYECSVDIGELVTIESVMEEFDLGPNGGESPSGTRLPILSSSSPIPLPSLSKGLIYCMEFLVENMDWLRKRLESLKGHYLIFDLPGQVELYTHHQGMHRLVQSIQEWGYRVGSEACCAVHPGILILLIRSVRCSCVP